MLSKIVTLQDVSEVYEWFRSMRDTRPVWQDEESGIWHIFRYSDVKTVNTDYTLFSSEISPVLSRRSQNERKREPGTVMITMDPPLHRQYRGLSASSFTPRALSRLSGRIAALTQGLLDQVRTVGHMDFVADIAYPLPALVIAEMLGVPPSDAPLFKQWADQILSPQAQENPVSISMVDYFEQMVAERSRQPREDMMSALQAARIDGEPLGLEDVLSFCILFLVAGHVTTVNLLSQAIRCFSEHPAAFAQLRAQPALLPGAIEEVLRYASPLWHIARLAKTDVPLAGVTIPAGARVLSWLASANRDEREFSEPERFDITRTPNLHQAFGHGIHFCIGAPLARLEASVVLPMVIEQLPDLHVEASHPLELLMGTELFGFKHLPVAFTNGQEMPEKHKAI
jgi:cytochrome P450